MTLVVGVLATAIALAGAAVTARARRVLPYVNRAGGLLLVVVGLYVSYYGIYETRLYLGGGDAADPIVETAGAIQQTLARWIDTVGVLPLVLALVAIVLGAITITRRRARKARMPAQR